MWARGRSIAGAAAPILQGATSLLRRLTGRPRVALAIAAPLVLWTAFVLGAEPIVRGRVEAFARSHRLEASVESVRLGWFSVTLGGVRLSPTGTTVAVQVKETRVELSAGLSPSLVVVHGAEVQIAGTPEEVGDGLRSWRDGQSRPEARSNPPRSVGVPLSLDGVSVSWVEPESKASLLDATDGEVSRVDGKWTVAFASCHGRRGALAIDATHPRLTVGASATLDDFEASRLSFVWTGEATASAPTATASADIAPPPLPVAGAPPPAEESTAAGLGLHFPELPLLQARIRAVARLIQERMSDGARIRVEALAFELGGQRRLAVGHGPLDAVRKGSEFELTFSTQQNSSGTPVSITTTLPLESGDPLVVLAGGPVSLALLGIDEGAAGLVDVASTTVTGRGRASLDGARGALTFDGELSVRGLAMNRPSVAGEIVRGIDATVLARGVLDDHGALRVDDAELSSGAIHLLAHGSAEQAKDHLAATLDFELARAPCENLLRSIPSALVPTLDGADFAGSFGTRGRLAFDSRKLDDLSFDWKVDDGCSMSEVPELLARERFTQPFDHAIYLPDGTVSEQTTGPTSENWSALDRISPFVQVAVLTTEDGAFYRHHGFNRAAMRNALVADLKAGRFVRGASTITMQLAKNLFLFRDKTLSRKLEEIILADYLEETFTKKAMMELYLNVIEFGPNVYGITEAAYHYFGRKPDELNLAESVFLASLLPSPIRFHKLAEKPQLSEGWTKHLRQLMAIAAKNNLVSPEELAEGLREDVFFHDPKDPLPAPRAPVSGAHFRPPIEEGDSDWHDARTN